MKKSYAVILAAGIGTRMGGDIAKQYQPLGKKPVLYYSIRAFEDSAVDGIVLVVADGMQDYVRKEIVEKYKFSKVTDILAGGGERYESVYRGLGALPEEGIVLVHDGARPFVDGALIARVLGKMETERACIPAVSVKDTIKRAGGGYIVETLPRDELCAVQTPQAFDLGVLKLAYRKYFGLVNTGQQERKNRDNLLIQGYNGDDTQEENRNMTGNADEPEQSSGCVQGIPLANRVVTDDAMLVEITLGIRAALVDGDYHNIKLTTPEDKIIADAYWKEWYGK